MCTREQSVVKADEKAVARVAALPALVGRFEGPELSRSTRY